MEGSHLILDSNGACEMGGQRLINLIFLIMRMLNVIIKSLCTPPKNSITSAPTSWTLQLCRQFFTTYCINKHTRENKMGYLRFWGIQPLPTFYRTSNQQEDSNRPLAHQTTKWIHHPFNSYSKYCTTNATTQSQRSTHCSRTSFPLFGLGCKAMQRRMQGYSK